MLTQGENVVKRMTFDVDSPLDTIFNNVEELVYIATAYINPYTKQKCIKLAYKIINKTGR